MGLSAVGHDTPTPNFLSEASTRENELDVIAVNHVTLNVLLEGSLP